MDDVYVDHLSYALGDEERTVEATGTGGRLVSGAAALAEAGFRKHHVCKPETTAYDLARRAVEPLRPHLTGVGAIIYATCLPLNGNVGNPDRFRETRDVKHLMDFPASRLQAEFGLDKAVVIGLNQQACTSMLGSMRLARMALAAEPDLGRILIVSADRFPEGANYEQAYNLISDGAAACIASLEAHGYKLLAAHGVTNGALSTASDDETVGSYFGYTHRVIRETLERAKLTMDKIDWVIPQNTSKKAWQILARLLRFDFERCWFGSLEDVGHVISQDNMINLRYLERAEKVSKGQRLLLFMAGFGLNWQCVILERV